MTLAEAQARLAKLRTAIDKAIESGGLTSYTINGRTKQVDLKFLREMERETEATVARLSNGSFYVSQFRNPE